METPNGARAPRSPESTRGHRLKVAASLRRQMGIEFFKPGAVLVRQGESMRRMYLIASGTVRVVLGAGSESQLLARLGRGAWIGETALLTGSVSSTTVVAETDVRVFTISQQDFLTAAETDPTVFREIARELAHRLRSADDLIERTDGRRLVELRHEPAHAAHVDDVLAACGRWARGGYLAVTLHDAGQGGRSVQEYVRAGEIASLRARLDGDEAVVVPAGGATEAELAAFIRSVSDFTDLVVIAGGSLPASVADDLAAIVTLGAPDGPRLVASGDVPHHVCPVDARFDAHRVARRICQQRVGLAFGGGGARGFAHIGVLKVLASAGIPIDAVTGASIGAAVAAGIAAGRSEDDVAASIESAGRWAAVPMLLPLHGIFTSTFVERELRRQFGDMRFEDLSLPLAVVAVDLHSGEEVVFTSGALVPALLASMAVPGIFAPVRHDGRVLIDGAVRNPVPAGTCRVLGADVVIASRMRVAGDAGAADEKRSLPWLPETIARALGLMQDQISEESRPDADVTIDTVISREQGGLFDFGHRHAIEAAGETAAISSLPGIAERVPGVRRAA
jgi:NTE family protein